MKKNNLFLLLLLNIQIIWSIDDVITDPAHKLDTTQPEDGDTEDSVFNGENNKNNESTISENSSQKNFKFAGDSSGQTNNAQNSFDNSSSDINENGITNAKVEATDAAQTVSRGLDFNGNPKLKGGYSGGFRDAGPQNDFQNSDTQKDNFQKVKNRDKALNDRLDLLDRNLTKALDGNDTGQIDYTEKQVEAEEREYNSIKGRVDANNQKIGRDWNLSLSRFGRGRDRQEKTSARQRSLQQAKEKIDSLKQKIGNFKKSKDLNNQSQNKNEGLQQDDNQVTGDQEVPDTDSFSRPSSLISEAGSDEPLRPSQSTSEPQDLARLRLSDSSNEGESSTDVQNGSVFSFDGQDYGNESSTDSGPTFSLEKSNEEKSDTDEQVNEYDPNEMDKAMEEMGDKNNNEDQEIDDWEGINIGERSKERVFGQNNEAKEGESSSVLPGDKLDYDGIYDKIWSDPNDPSGSYASNDDERNNDDEGNVEQVKKDLDASNLSGDQKEQLKNEFKESFPNSNLSDQDENNEQDFAQKENYNEERQIVSKSLLQRIENGDITSIEQLENDSNYKKLAYFNRPEEESSMQAELKYQLKEKQIYDAFEKRLRLNEESKEWKDSSSENYSKEYSELYDKIWSYPDDEKGSDYYAKDQLENDIKNTDLSADQKEQLRNEIDERDREDANQKSWQQERDEWWRQRAEKQEKEIQRRQQEEENARLKAQSKRRPFSWPK